MGVVPPGTTPERQVKKNLKVQQVLQIDYEVVIVYNNMHYCMLIFFYGHEIEIEKEVMYTECDMKNVLVQIW